MAETIQTNWRIDKETIEQLKSDVTRLKFKSVPALVNVILGQYVSGASVKRGR